MSIVLKLKIGVDTDNCTLLAEVEYDNSIYFLFGCNDTSAKIGDMAPVHCVAYESIALDWQMFIFDNEWSPAYKNYCVVHGDKLNCLDLVNTSRKLPEIINQLKKEL